MPKSKEIEVKSIDKAPTEPDTKKNNIGLRAYKESDKPYVQHLFYSTYFNHVPRAVWQYIKSPVVLAPWIAFYALLMNYVPNSLSKLNWSSNMLLAVQVVISIGVLGLGAVILFTYADKIDITRRVMQGLDNDLKDPELHYDKDKFWVLTINDDEIIGCIGVDQNLEPVMDKSATCSPYIPASKRPRAADAPEIHSAEWKSTAIILAKIDDVVRITLVSVLEFIYSIYEKVRGPVPEKVRPGKVLFNAHQPNEASIRRLAIKLEFQDHGLSTALLKRVALWAHANQIKYLYADCNELQTRLASILVKKHGYVLVETKRTDLFNTNSTFKLDVNKWAIELKQ